MAKQKGGLGAGKDALLKVPQQQKTAATPVEQPEKDKATFYIAVSILDQLEDVVPQLKRMASRDKKKQINKSTVVEAALRLALADLDENDEQSDLAGILLKQ